MVQELVETLGDADARPEDLHRLPQTTAALNESMRLFPPLWAIGREVLAPIQLRTHNLPIGVHVLIPQWVVHRDPRWFVGPLWYRPERWLNGETDGIPRFAYFPFGGGARVCIGAHFARMESILVLATLLRSYRFTAQPGYRPELLPSATLRPTNGIQLCIEARRRQTEQR